MQAMEAYDEEGLHVFPGSQGLQGIDSCNWMTTQQGHQLARLNVTLPNGDILKSENVALSWRRGGGGSSDGVCFVLSTLTSAFVRGKPFRLEWGGGQKPDLGHKSELPWVIVLRLHGEDQQAVHPNKAHKVGAWARCVVLIGRFDHLCARARASFLCSSSQGSSCRPLQLHAQSVCRHARANALMTVSIQKRQACNCRCCACSRALRLHHQSQQGQRIPLPASAPLTARRR